MGRGERERQRERGEGGGGERTEGGKQGRRERALNLIIVYIIYPHLRNKYKTKGGCSSNKECCTEQDSKAVNSCLKSIHSDN